jgi:hypothetical protein
MVFQKIFFNRGKDLDAIKFKNILVLFRYLSVLTKSLLCMVEILNFVSIIEVVNFYSL